MTTGTAALESGRLIGRYRIARLLGQGGMGAVYEAQHTELGKVVALKVMLPEAMRDPALLSRFMGEARAAATIDHPAIVEVFDLGSDGDIAFIAMEKLDGEELQQRIDRTGALPVELVVRLGIELADGMASAHARGIVHRDLKPANVFLATRGRGSDVVKILDFGIAKLTEEQTGRIETRTGAVFGSPLFMAPEQLRDSKSVDARADIYGIGAILFNALASQPPFDAPTMPELMYKISFVQPPSLRARRPDVPAWLQKVIERCLAKDPANRFQCARDIVSALEARDDADVANISHLDTMANVSLSDTMAVPRSSEQVERAGARTTQDLPPLSGARSPAKARVWPFAAGASVLVLAAVSMWWLNADGDAVTGPSPSTSVAPLGRPLGSATSSEQKAPEARPPASADAPRITEVTFVTLPAGARILLNGVATCEKTPCRAPLSGEKPVVVSAALTGYAASAKTLSAPFPSAVTLELERARPSGTSTTKTNASSVSTGSAETNAPPPLRPR